MKKKLLFALVAVLALIIAIAVFAESQNDPQIKEWCRQFLDGMISGDMDAAYEVMAAVITEEEFEPLFEHYHSEMKGTKSYELERLGWQCQVTGGIKTNVATYLMKSDHGNYIIEITDSSNTTWPDNVVFGTQEEIEPFLKPY